MVKKLLQRLLKKSCKKQSNRAYDDKNNNKGKKFIKYMLSAKVMIIILTFGSST